MASTGNMIGAGILGASAALMPSQNYPNPANAASPYLQQIPGTITPYYQPYINAGTRSMQGASNLGNVYAGLIKDPTAMMNKIGAGYTVSPGYQYNVQQATQAANNAAAAGGMLGSPEEQQQLASVTSGLASQDYYNYLDRALKQYGTGLSGAQGLTDFYSQLGYGASNDLATSLANVLSSQANLAFAGQATQDKLKAEQDAQKRGIIGAIGGLFSK